MLAPPTPLRGRAIDTLEVLDGRTGAPRDAVLANAAAALVAAGAAPEAAGGLWVYRLKVQKQPGTLAQTLILNLRLPAGAEIKSATLPLQASADAWTAQVDLRQDLTLEISFRLK